MYSSLHGLGVMNLNKIPQIDLDLAKFVDLHILHGYISHSKITHVCNTVKKHGFRAVCLPARYLNIFQELYPALQFITVANFPFNYHPSDVVIREVEAITALIEDISQVEIEFPLPTDFRAYWKEFKALGTWVPLRGIIPFSRYTQLLPMLGMGDNPFKYVQLGTGFDLKGQPPYEAIKTKVKTLQSIGYKVKVCGNYEHYQKRELAEMGVILGLTGGLNSVKYKKVELTGI